MILLLLLCLLLILEKEKAYEGLTKRDKPVLLGDSIFENSSYVLNRESVGEKIKKEMNVKILAKDGARIRDIMEQSKKIEDDDTHIFISIGGNDILEELFYKKGGDLNRIWREYENEIMELKERVNGEIVLVDIYFITEMKYRRMHKYIHKWNKKIEEFGEREGMKVYKISKLLKKDSDFTHGIEPSKIGGEKLANGIIEF